jgi:hypothetical protein
MAYDDSFFLIASFALAGALGYAAGYGLAMLFERIFRR